MGILEYKSLFLWIVTGLFAPFVGGQSAIQDCMHSFYRLPSFPKIKLNNSPLTSCKSSVMMYPSMSIFRALPTTPNKAILPEILTILKILQEPLDCKRSRFFTSQGNSNFPICRYVQFLCHNPIRDAFQNQFRQNTDTKTAFHH